MSALKTVLKHSLVFVALNNVKFFMEKLQVQMKTVLWLKANHEEETNIFSFINCEPGEN